ncbi:FMN phosphatase YigB (HAD superfamily) [Pseudarthrobacter oxydans]|nr:hypothetical protein [Pseudarthrobacter oxydans]MDP9981591.1 FMN phosphatase YigB (HAD superfamily) [Pseudarthrobacter oxydans]
MTFDGFELVVFDCDGVLVESPAANPPRTCSCTPPLPALIEAGRH